MGNDIKNLGKLRQEITVPTMHGDIVIDLADVDSEGTVEIRPANPKQNIAADNRNGDRLITRALTVGLI